MRMRVAVPTAPAGSDISLPPVEAVGKLLGEGRAGNFQKNLNKLRDVIARCKLHPPAQPSNLVLNIRRDRILEDALWHFLKEPMSDPMQLRAKMFQVKFVGEEGIDQGGLTREFYQSLTHAFVDPSPALFATAENNDYTYQINPLSGINPEHLQYFELIGKVIAKSIFDGVQLDVHFSPAFYKSMLGMQLNFTDLETVDVELYKSLQYLQENEINDQGLCLYFTASYDEFGVAHEEPLKEGGGDIEVTDENKAEFITLKTAWRLEGRIKEQMDAIRRGFYQVMPQPELLAIEFDDRELELILCGIPEIDVVDWRQNTEYKSGYKATDKVIKMFWKVSMRVITRTPHYDSSTVRGTGCDVSGR